MANGQRSARSWITEGMIITLVTAGAYFFSLCYEIAVCQFFWIPVELISFNSALVLGRMILLFFIFVAIYSILSLAYQTGIIYSGRILTNIILMIVILLLTFGIQYLYFGKLWRTNMWIFSVFFLAGIICLSLVLVRENMSFDRLITLVIAIVGYGIFIYYMAGYAYAKYQAEFFVINHSPKLVVLRIYGDYLITAPLVTPVKSEGNNQVNKTLQILKLSEMDKTPLTLEKELGPLTVKQ
jgi:hypothetical protein